MEKIEKLMSINFHSKPTYGNDDKCIKRKRKTYEDSVTTNFYNEKGSKKIPEEKIPCKCLLVIMLDSVLYTYESIIPKHFEKNENIKNNNNNKRTIMMRN